MTHINSYGTLTYKRITHLGQKTRPNNNQQKKKRTWKIVDFTVLADHRMKLKEREKKGKYLDLARELKKLWNMKVTVISIVIIKGTGGLGSLRASRDHPNYNINENDQNTEKSPRDLRRLAVTQTPLKNHQLKLMWKTLKALLIVRKRSFKHDTSGPISNPAAKCTLTTRFQTKIHALHPLQHYISNYE